MSAAGLDRGFVARWASQLGRFGLVGVANTLVDLALTNLLFLRLAAAQPGRPDGGDGDRRRHRDRSIRTC